jgi:adenylate cyclase class 2
VREIEVKYRCDDIETLLADLKSRGIGVSDPLYQDDQAYAPDGWRFGDSKIGVSFLRLRTAAGRHTFTLKEPALNEQACLEYETEIADRETMHRAVLRMGYRPTVRIAKTRRTASYDGCSLCIDDVEGIGGFIEAERMVPDDADAGAVQASLAALIESLNLAVIRTTETYDSLVYATRNTSTERG